MRKGESKKKKEERRGGRGERGERRGRGRRKRGKRGRERERVIYNDAKAKMSAFNTRTKVRIGEPNNSIDEALQGHANGIQILQYWIIQIKCHQYSMNRWF